MAETGKLSRATKTLGTFPAPHSESTAEQDWHFSGVFSVSAALSTGVAGVVSMERSPAMSLALVMGNNSVSQSTRLGIIQTRSGYSCNPRRVSPTPSSVSPAKWDNKQTHPGLEEKKVGTLHHIWQANYHTGNPGCVVISVPTEMIYEPERVDKMAQCGETLSLLHG